MPFCPNCGKEVLPADVFCLNCGHDMRRVQPPASNVSYQSIPQPQLPPSQPPHVSGPKNAWGAAVLNFFFPGLGYVYIGVGRNNKTAIFGILLFFSLTLYFYVSVLAGASGQTTATAATPSLETDLAFLSLLFPVAVAYDAYQRAMAA